MPRTVGTVSEIWRYPVKSMRGEQLTTVRVYESGVDGDRIVALMDCQTGKVASAKNPRLWHRLFEYSAALVSDTEARDILPLIRILSQHDETLTTHEPTFESRLSSALGRKVRLARQSGHVVMSEGYWPDYDWLPSRNQTFEFPLPTGTFFDGMPIHILSTSTLAYLNQCSPDVSFDVARFRPNFVINTTHLADGFAEDSWIGGHLQLGDVRFKIERPCPRCVMTTLPQGGLKKDAEILRTSVRTNHGNVGVYATVVSEGTVRSGDSAVLS